MSNAELIHRLIVASGPFVLFVGFILMVMFVPVGVRRRLTPWLLGLAAVGLTLLFLPSILAGAWIDLSLPALFVGLAILELAPRARTPTLGYVSAGGGAAIVLAGGLAYFFSIYQRAGASFVAMLVLAFAVSLPSLMAYLKIKQIRTARVDGAVTNHPMGTGTPS